LKHDDLILFEAECLKHDDSINPAIGNVDNVWPAPLQREAGLMLCSVTVLVFPCGANRRCQSMSLDCFKDKRNEKCITAEMCNIQTIDPIVQFKSSSLMFFFVITCTFGTAWSALPYTACDASACAENEVMCCYSFLM